MDFDSENESERESVHPTRTQQQLTPLRELITNKPPYISGTLQLPPSCFSLFYRTKDVSDARHIDLANATSDELEQLVEACEPTSSDTKKKGKTKGKAKGKADAIMDGPAKMDQGSFAPVLVPSVTNLVKVISDYHFEPDKSDQRIKIDLRELNVYSEGSFIKPRVETPPNKRTFGSLTIIFPTPHEGGVMSLRNRTSHQEWSFDPSPDVTDTHQPSIGYVVMPRLKGVQHGVAPVTSGYRVTLTYDLYAENDDGPISKKNQQASETTPLLNERTFNDELTTLLENGEFLTDGGTLAFGLTNAYSFKESLNHVRDALKGKDAVMYRTLRGLGFEPVLRMYYHEWDPDIEGLNGLAVIFDRVEKFSLGKWPELDEIVSRIVEFASWTSGQLARPDDLPNEPEYGYEESAEVVTWVTPLTTYNRKKSVFTSIIDGGKVANTNVVYGDLGLFVRIGKAGGRLSYRKVASEHMDLDDEDDSENEAISVDSDSGAGSEYLG